MRAVVTGGAGFIGSALVDRLLAEGHAVEVVDDLSTGSLALLADARAAGGDFRFHQLDVAAPELVELLARRRPEVVYHLATSTSVASSLADPVADLAACLLGGVRLLEAARAAGARKVVVATSGAALLARGPGEDLEAPALERDASGTRSPAGAARRALLDYLAAYREREGLEFSALALGTVYGPRQLDRLREPAAEGTGGVVARFASRLAEGAPGVIEGDGRQTRDFVYVDDVVDAFSRAKERGSGLLLNVATGIETSVSRLWSLMSALAGRFPGTHAAPGRPGEVGRVALDPSRAGIHLGWRPWTSLEEGAAAMLAAAGAFGRDQAVLGEEALR